MRSLFSRVLAWSIYLGMLKFKVFTRQDEWVVEIYVDRVLDKIIYFETIPEMRKWMKDQRSK